MIIKSILDLYILAFQNYGIELILDFVRGLFTVKHKAKGTRGLLLYTVKSNFFDIADEHSKW